MHALTLPRLGQTMQAGRIVEWLVAEGASYAEGAPIYSIETDKTVLEVQATLPGTLLKRLVGPDEEVPVGSIVAVAADAGEQVAQADVQSFIEARGAGARQMQSGPMQPGPMQSGPMQSGPTQPGEGTAEVEPPLPTSEGSRVLKAMPRAKRLARELGVELSRITDPSGPDAVITEKDVMRMSQLTASAGVTAGTQGVRRARRAIERSLEKQMTRSWAVPQFSQDIEVDAEAILARRRHFTDLGVEASLTSVILDALVTSLKAVPQCNATFDGSELIEFQGIHAGIAVATSRGLLVPVLRDCEAGDFAQRSRRLAALLGRARDGSLGPDELAGGTVTLSNLGYSRVETGVPIINAPQVCLVFTGAIVEKPVVSNGRITVGKRMHIVCVYDHRVIDGVTGARFVDALSTALAAAI
jgi:pyruvate dehydrogenase E2 component (dihydrolipoyllysine-residue acetyltransferase)